MSTNVHTNVHTTHPQPGRPVGRDTAEQTLDDRAETATVPASGGGKFCDAVVATARNPQGTPRSHPGHEPCTERGGGLEPAWYPNGCREGEADMNVFALPATGSSVYDNYRMNKQAISVTLSPDNLLWLRGRARADQRGSLSEYLDRLITRARFGQDAPRVVRSMKGALKGLVAEPRNEAAAISPDVWQAWRTRWDDLLAGVDTTSSGPARTMRLGSARASLAVAEGKPVSARRPRRA